MPTHMPGRLCSTGFPGDFQRSAVLLATSGLWVALSFGLLWVSGLGLGFTGFRVLGLGFRGCGA